MKNNHRHAGVYLIEVFLFLVCIVGIVAFFRIRSSLVDVLFLILWGVVLLVFIPLVIHGEIRLRHEEEVSDFIINGDIKDGE